MQRNIEKLSKIMETFGLSPAELANKLGESNQTINNWKKRGMPSSCYSKLVSVFPSINANWLLNNIGDITSNVLEEPQKSYTSGVPYFNVDFIAGFDIVLNDQTIIPEYRIDFKKYNDADYWVNITGHSMEPLISNGDIIAIKEVHSWRDFLPFGDVYGIITNEFRTVKKVTKSDRGNDFLKLIPVNEAPEYQPQDIPIKLITHVFKVLGCAKKL
jgi:SOS-response transcriptional repressor LexA